MLELIKSSSLGDQRTEQWFNIRRTMVTASEIAAIINPNEPGARNAVMRRKTGNGGDYDTSNVAAIQHRVVK